MLFAMLTPYPLGYRLILAGVASLAFGTLTAILAPQKDRKGLRLVIGFALAMAAVVLVWSFEFTLEGRRPDNSIIIGFFAAMLAFAPRFNKPTKDDEKTTQF